MSIEIYDTTLRDGSQQEGISLTVDDKLRIARLLDDLGVAFVEGGWPGANPKDTEFFARARSELSMSNAVLTAFGSTRRPGGTAANDSQIKALLDAETEYICLVSKASDVHVRTALRTDLDEALAMVGDSVSYLRNQGRRVFFDAEHFFDGYRSNPDFALDVLRVAAESGAERLVLCDTNGGTLPSGVTSILGDVMTRFDGSDLGVHFHNDVGTAVASSLTAADLGIRQVQGCVNGYGERTGNADLSTLIPDLQMKMEYKPIAGDLKMLTPISHHIAEIVNVTLDPHRPYVGASAFTHKAGLHTSALARDTEAYEHEDPSTVGNSRRMLVSELAGRAALLSKADELGLEMDPSQALEVIERVKSLEAEGYHYEAADGSLELLIRRQGGWVNPFFELDEFNVVTSGGMAPHAESRASVRLIVDEQARLSEGAGVGPVDALDHALRDALSADYPEVGDLRLTDYRVRVLDSKDGASAKVRVLIDTSNHATTWGTVGVHENIIEASWQALSEGITVGLLKASSKPAFTDQG